MTDPTPFVPSKLSGGSGGIFIINSQSTGVVVIKTTGQVFQEVYGLHLGKADFAHQFFISLGQAFSSSFCSPFPFRVTSVVVFYHKTEQFQQIIGHLKRLSPLRSGGLNTDIHKIQRLSEQKYFSDFILVFTPSHLEVIEYVDGLTFRASEGKAKAIFGNPLTFTKLGSIIAYDMLINNWDRGRAIFAAFQLSSVLSLC